MHIFEKKTEHWGLKDPLEVRVQHGTKKIGVFYAGTVGRNEFFYKIRWSEKSILAR